MPTHFVEGQEFWPKYYALPEKIRDRADRRYELLEIQPDHHRLAFEKRCDTEGGGLYKGGCGSAASGTSPRSRDGCLPLVLDRET